MVAMAICLPGAKLIVSETSRWEKRLSVHSTGTTTGAGAAGDGGYNGEAVVIVHRGVFLMQVADVLVVEIKVDEGAQLALISIQVASQVRVLGGESQKRVAHTACPNLD